MTDLRLDGVVGIDFDARSVVDALAAAGGDPVRVTINSGGGMATEGAAIHAELVAYRGRITVRVVGLAASAASLIAMAGDDITMAAGSLMMLHDPAAWSTTGRGTAEDHRRDADALDRMGEAYAAIYAARSGNTLDTVREWMRAETWLTGAEAVALGFADFAEADDRPAMTGHRAQISVALARAQAAFAPQP